MQELFNKAQILHQKGQLPQAEKIYLEIMKVSPNHPVVSSRLVMLYQQAGRLSEALSYAKIAVSALPEQVDLLLQAANIATQMGEGGLAEQWLKQANHLQQDQPSILEQLAGVLISNHKEAEALELSKKLIRLDPKNANAYNLKGLAQSRLGDTDKGYVSFQKSIKLNPGQISTIRNLVLYGKGKKDPLLEKIIPQLEGSFNSGSQSPQVQMNLAYILSMYFEKRKEAAKSFAYLKAGNDLNRSSYQYSHDQTVKLFAQIKHVFSTDLIEGFNQSSSESRSSEPEQVPIFILGMPRSGTTLVEQILSSHSSVEAEGEIVDLRESFDQYPEAMAIDTETTKRIELIKKIGAQYLERVGSRQESPIFTDKMPYNFMMLGAIALAMPYAKIIHCTRDPLETCFSIFKQNFAGSHAYTNNLEELGQYYNEYLELMAHWTALFGDRIHEANYESIVADSETEIGRLLDFCGLERESSCYKFYQNKRAVRTASVAQVRQPIYKDAVKASTPYREYLKPLEKVLSSGV